MASAHCTHSLYSSSNGPMAIYLGDYIRGKKNTKTFPEVLDRGSELVLLPRDPKCPHSSLMNGTITSLAYCLQVPGTHTWYLE